MLLCGHGRSGKDLGCEYLEEITGLRNAGTFSVHLADYVAEKLGLPTAEAYARRHESDDMRVVWYTAGNELRDKGPSTLAHRALAKGEITGGSRSLEEITAIRAEGLFDLIVWVARAQAPVDPTMKFGPEMCDVIVENHWSKAEYRVRLERLAAFAGLLKQG